MRTSRLASCVISLVLVGCTSPNEEPICDPGANQVCYCPGGKQGVQTCDKDGTSWLKCLGCNQVDARTDLPVDSNVDAAANADLPKKDASADVPGADRLKPDTLKPDTLKPDTLKPDTLKPDTPKPDTLKPDTLKPDTLKPDTPKPDTLKPDTLKPDTLKPDTVLTPDIYVPVCGNGIKDPLEKCDTAISAGSAGACPIACSDGVACTSDVLKNPGTCQAECAFAAIAQCVAGDGCCPTSCTFLNDSDCSPPCASLYFNGTAYVEVPHHADLNPGTGNFTVEGWVRPDTDGSGVLASKRVGQNYYRITVCGDPATSTTLDSWYVANAGWGQWSTPNLARGGQWTHVVAQRESGQIKHFINGVLQTNTVTIHNGSANPSAYDFNNTGSLLIGKQLLGDYYKGYIAELRVTNAAVYSANFTPQKVLYALSQTVGLYHMREGIGVTANDFSGKAHNGTINGATWSTACP